MIQKKIILACESSCDETSWCIYDADKECIKAHTVNSQALIHKNFGGVVPDLASSHHLPVIDSLLVETLKEAAINLSDISHFAATIAPGLSGALLIGASYTKALAWSFKKPFKGINHLAGHIYSVFIEHQVPFPYLCLSASGGHTALYIVYDWHTYTCIANTRDDAAGELFDKVSKFLQMGYPGGPLLEKIAEKNNFLDSKRYPRLKNTMHDFSFSGLKTAVLYDLVESGHYSLKEKKLIHAPSKEETQAIASSIMVAVADIFISRIQLAHKNNREIKAVAFVGGVACNRYIQSRIAMYAKKQNLLFFVPSKNYCTDNAAMIAVVAANTVTPDLGYEVDIKP